MDAEFRHLTGFDLPPWRPNLAADRLPSRNDVFPQLASWAFDHPERLAAMCAWARFHVEQEPGPRTWELLGYFQYLVEDWTGAAQSFMRSVEAEPRNLDAWFSLAFALKHLGLDLGESILFDHDLWVRLQADRGGPLSLSRLRRHHEEIQGSAECYRQTWAEHARPYLV